MKCLIFQNNSFWPTVDTLCIFSAVQCYGHHHHHHHHQKNPKLFYSRNGIYMPWSGEKVKKKVFFLKKNPNFFFCFGEGGRYRYSSIRSFALTLSTPMNRVNKNFEKNDWCAFNIINHPSKYQTRNLNEYHFRPLLLVKNPILPYGHENLRAFFSRLYLGSTYQIDTKVVGLW